MRNQSGIAKGSKTARLVRRFRVSLREYYQASGPVPTSDLFRIGWPSARTFAFRPCTGLLLYLFLGTSCSAPRALRGGRAITTHEPAGLQQTLVQGENASQVTSQVQETLKERTYTLPSGSRIEEARILTAASGNRVTNLQAVVVSAPTPVLEREETRARTELGAAQKDTARELGAKLSSFKGIMWVGLALFGFGLASLVWPPLKAIIGSVTTSAAIILGGLALLVLPTLIVGNELLILGGVALTAGAWFFAHRHGQLRGLVVASAQRRPPNR